MSKYANLAPDQVLAVFQSARNHFEASPIRDFVPLLVERRARTELVTRSATASV